MPIKIFIVEDEPLVALEIEEALTKAGCVVTGMAHTVEKALAALQCAALDAVILDANLKGETAEPIVQQLKIKAVPFVLVSGYQRDQLGFKEENAPLVVKPFVAEELVSALRKCLM